MIRVKPSTGAFTGTEFARASFAGLPHPRLGNDLPAAGTAAMQIQLAELQHLARRHQHVVAAKIDALRIARPRG